MAPPLSHSQTVLPAQNLVLDKIERVDGRFLVDVHVRQAAHCPACGKRSRSRHSAYLRHLKDLPWQGCAVELRLKIRRFRCRNRTCVRKIFAEPIPEVTRSHARWTTRVGEIIRLIGYTAGGLPGSRIPDRLAIPISDDTVTRFVKRSGDGSGSGPIRHIGVDDWAWRKGQTYGTILVDLDKHQVIDLLPDRSVESLQAWLEKHPGVEVIARDRCGNLCRGRRTRCRPCSPGGRSVSFVFESFNSHREIAGGTKPGTLPSRSGAGTASRRSRAARQTKNNAGGATKTTAPPAETGALRASR